MKLPAKLWDFLFGVLITGTVPMVAFYVTLFLVGMAFPNPDTLHGWFQTALLSVVVVTGLIAPLATWYFVCRWRMKHRLLPRGFLPVEMAIGFLLSAAFFVFVVATWGMAAIN